MTKTEIEKLNKLLKQREEVQKYCDENWARICYYKQIEYVPEPYLELDEELRSELADIDAEIFLIKTCDEELRSELADINDEIFFLKRGEDE